MTPQQYEQALIHLQLHYGNDQGLIALCPRIGGNLAQRMWPQDYARKALEALPADGDLYFSLNAFAKRKDEKLNRKATSLWYLHAFYMDLDTMKIGLDPDDVMKTLEREFWGVRLPAPTYAILSGRGVWAVWTIVPVKNDMAGRSVKRWKEVQGFLFSLLKPFGADHMVGEDVARICRIAGSTNPKIGATVSLKVYQPEGRYTLADLWDFVPKPEPLPTPTPSTPLHSAASPLFWPTTPEEFGCSPKRQQAPSDNKRCLSPHTWLQGALSDLERLVCRRRPRDGDGRNNILYRYAVWQFALTKDAALVAERSRALNMCFGESLPEGEVRSTVDSACKELPTEDGNLLPRRFKTATTIGVLHITPEEQREMRVLIGKEEKRRRDLQRKEAQRRAKGVLSRADRARERLECLAQAIREHPDATDHKLAKLLDWSPATVKSYRKRLVIVNSVSLIQSAD